jgi:hypothetical protein
MAVTASQVAYECAADFANSVGNLEAVAAQFETWIDTKVGGGTVAEDAYAALRTSAEQTDDYCPPGVVLSNADVVLASLEALEFDTVPNIVGMTATAANAAILAAGMTVGTVTESAGTLNIVLSQGTAAGTKVTAGAALAYVKGNTP